MQTRNIRNLGRRHGAQAARIAARKCPSCSYADLLDLAKDIFESDLLSLDWTYRGRPVQELFGDSAQKWREYEKAARKSLVEHVRMACTTVRFTFRD